MNKILLLIFCVITLSGNAQESAWFMGGTYIGDLLQVTMYQDSVVLKQAFIFGDSIQSVHTGQLNDQLYKQDVSPLSFTFANDTMVADNTQFFESLMGFYLKQTDSIEVSGKWYTIQCQMSDDGFIGGRMNAVHQQVTVRDLGIIYNSQNLMAHTLFMLCHHDPEKQKVLQAVYKHLEGKNAWEPWAKLADLASRYTYDTCAEMLKQQWTETRLHLQLVSCLMENIGNQIRVNVTIKNVSDINYTLPPYAMIAPASAMIYFGETFQPGNLLETHYGEHFKGMDKEVFLSPGEEVSFAYSFREYYGCGGCSDVTYSGFQVFSGFTFLNWMLNDPVPKYGRLYSYYPHREIKS